MAMQNFINIDRIDPDKRDSAERIHDFKEIYNILQKKKLRLRQVDVFNAGILFVTTNVLYIILFLIG